jgi:uncharacterized membrane protein
MTRIGSVIRLAAFIIFAVLGQFIAMAHPPAIMNQAGEKAIEEEIVAFRKMLADTIKSREAMKLRDLYARSFVHTDETATQDNRDTRIADAVRGRSIIETAEVADLVIRIPNDWTAIATGTSRVGSTTSSTTYAVRWTAVYVRTDKFWALAASQATRLP